MTLADTDKFDALDRMLNDPDVAMNPDLVWSLLEELREQDATGSPATG